MNVLAIDYGMSRVGIALGNTDVCIASPIEVIPHKDDTFVLDRVVEIIQHEGIEKIIIGLPINMKGEDTEQTKITRVFKASLEQRSSLPVEVVDERFTSKMAHSFEQQGASKKLHDALAAMAILQTYFDTHHR
jgi:putative Holliday junction resolvase